MKKILFILGITFSVYSFAEQGFSISETDTYEQVSKNAIFKLTDPATKRFEFRAKPDNIFGVLVNDQNIEFGSVAFGKQGIICQAFIKINGKDGFNTMLNRLEATSTKDVKVKEILKNEIYELQDKSKKILVSYTQPDNYFVVDIRPKGVECIQVKD